MTRSRVIHKSNHLLPLSAGSAVRRHSDISPSQPPVWTGTPPIIWGNGLNVRPQAALTPTNIYSQVTNIYSQIHEYLLTNSRIFTHKFTNIYSQIHEYLLTKMCYKYMNFKANLTPSCITLYLPINTCRGPDRRKIPQKGVPKALRKCFFKN